MIPRRRCSKCQKEKPYTGDYFPTKRGRINGAACRECSRVAVRRHYDKDRRVGALGGGNW
jgi:hypothetical protein